MTVRPQVSGVITQVHVHRGPDGEEGPAARARSIRVRSRSRCSRRSARASATRRSSRTRALTLQRYRTLLQQDSIARQDVDTQAALVKQLEGTITIDRAAESTARLNLGYSRIVAPVAGRVGLRPVDAGNFVGAGDANGVAVITQLAPIDVEFAVPQDRVPEVQARVAAGAKLPVDRARPHAHRAARRRRLRRRSTTRSTCRPAR